MKPEYALSIRQPWAFLIAKGWKDIENRNWKIGRNDQHGGYQSQRANFKIQLPARIYIHAGLDESEMKSGIASGLLQWIKDRLSVCQRAEMAMALMSPGLYFGGIIGEVTITGCVTESKSPWFTGKYGFPLKDAVMYEKPIPCRGALGFFKPNIEEGK